MDNEVKPLSEAADFEEFKELRAAAGKETAAAEPAEKTPQAEEAKPVIAAEPGTADKTVQEPPAEKTVDDQIKELRAKGKHAQANKLMVDSAVKAEREEKERLKQELEALRSRPAERPAEAPAKPATTAASATDSNDPEPNPTDAKYDGADGYTKYLRDVGRWDARQQFRELQAKQQTQQSQQEIARTVMQRIAAFKAAKPEHADFDAVTAGTWDPNTNTGTGLWLTPAMMQFARESENAPAVLYHLGKNMAEHARIVALSPAMQLATLGQIAHLIATPAVNAPENRKPAVTKASPPPRVLSGADTPEPKSTAEASSYEEFKQLRRAQRGSSAR